MQNTGPIEQAIDNLISQKMFNIKSTVKKYNIIESILRRHFKN